MEIDLHGLTVAQAKKMLDQKLNNLPKTTTELTIVHGYHSGNALATYVRKTYSHKRLNRKILGLNQGVTIFSLKY